MKGLFDSLLAYPSRSQSQENGEKFENFIATYFLKSKDFKIVSGPKRYVFGAPSEDITNPDLCIEHIPSKTKFRIECKWRGRWDGDAGSEKISLEAERAQFNRHRNIQKETKIRSFLALGIGKLVATEQSFIPMELYCLPLDMIYENFKELRKEYLIRCGKQQFIFPPYPSFDQKRVDFI